MALLPFDPQEFFDRLWLWLEIERSPPIFLMHRIDGRDPRECYREPFLGVLIPLSDGGVETHTLHCRLVLMNRSRWRWHGSLRRQQLGADRACHNLRTLMRILRTAR